MARTREQWNTIVGDYAASKGISTSSVADWLLLRDLAVTIAIIIETTFEFLNIDVEQKLLTKNAGTLRWYPGMVKAFQLGHDLEVDANGNLGYETIDEEAQIVTQVSVKKAKKEVSIKVAKADGGDTVQLTTGERDALLNYLDEQIPPGVDWYLASLPADVVKDTTVIEYDTLYDKPTLLASVQAAREAFRANFPFNALFYKSQYNAAIKAVPGVVSVVSTIDMTLNNGTETVTNLAEKKELPAGYFVWHEDSTLTANPAE